MEIYRTLYADVIGNCGAPEVSPAEGLTWVSGFEPKWTLCMGRCSVRPKSQVFVEVGTSCGGVLNKQDTQSVETCLDGKGVTCPEYPMGLVSLTNLWSL